jgi:NAD(P)H-dependent flavin oxidoreductase YrpB (nitropropane dioxygenase family)
MEGHGAKFIGPLGPTPRELYTRKNSMLKRRITEQYGLKVPFVNADMAFIANRAPRTGGVQGGGMGMLGATAMPPDVLQAAFREIKAAGPA